MTRTFSYNAANQLISDGVHTYTYDPRGNLLTKMQGATVIETSSYDRANRLLNVDGTSYGYDGDGQRIRQTVGGTVTEYLVDAAAGLPVVVQATRGAAVTRNVHAVGGVLSEQNPDGTWEWLLRDGLGSVRSVTDAAGAVLETVDYSPYGVPNAALTRTAYGFTGEMTDTNGRVYLRARYYHPTLGTFPTLDPFEGAPERPLSLHGYSWVEGNVVNATDPTGESMEDAIIQNSGNCCRSACLAKYNTASTSPEAEHRLELCMKTCDKEPWVSPVEAEAKSGKYKYYANPCGLKPDELSFFPSIYNSCRDLRDTGKKDQNNNPILCRCDSDSPNRTVAVYHPGIDILTTLTPIRAASSGRVIRAGWFSGPNESYGNHIVIQHANQVTSLYAHLSRIDVNEGDEVCSGQQIGISGTTGASSTDHLHFEIRKAHDNARYPRSLADLEQRYLNPVDIIPTLDESFADISKANRLPPLSAGEFDSCPTDLCDK